MKLHYPQISKRLLLLNKKYLQVSGVDTKKFLQGLSTNDFQKLTKRSESLATAFLNTKGRVVADAIAYDYSTIDEQSVILESHQDLIEDLQRHLNMYKLRSKVTLQSINLETIVNGDDSLNENFIFTSADPRSQTLGFRTLRHSSTSSNQLESTTELASNRMRYECHRYLAGIGEGREISGRIPLEMNLDFLNYISFNKGCYIGQELVARTYFKGQIRKRLVPFAILPGIFSTLVESVDVPFTTTSDPEHSRNLEANSIDIINSLRNTELSSLCGNEQITSSNKALIGRKIYMCGQEGSPNGLTEGDVGEIISINLAFGLGLALIRLDSLYSSTPRTRTYKTSNDSSSIVELRPFQPQWWPSIDPSSGKPLESQAQYSKMLLMVIFQVLLSIHTTISFRNTLYSSYLARLNIKHSNSALFSSMPGRDGRQQAPKTPPPPINNFIKATTVRLIVPGNDTADNDVMVGIMPLAEALTYAERLQVDLVMINDKAEPPVCKCIDYGKFKYMIEKKKKENAKKQIQSEIKEVKMSYKIEQHDFDVRVRSIQKFLADGDRVKVVVQFKGRELQYKDLGKDLLLRIYQPLDSVASMESPPKIEGKAFAMLLGPKKTV